MNFSKRTLLGREIILTTLATTPLFASYSSTEELLEIGISSEAEKYLWKTI